MDERSYPYVYQVATDNEIQYVRRNEGSLYEILKISEPLEVSIDYYYWSATLGFSERDEFYYATDKFGRKLAISYRYWDLILPHD